MNQECMECIYSNRKGRCWARKGKAVYGKSRCNFIREIKKEEKNE